MTTDTSAGKPMSSRLCVSRATNHVQLRCLYMQVLLAAGVVRQRRVPNRGSHSGVHTKILPVDRLRILLKLHIVKPSAMYYNV